MAEIKTRKNDASVDRFLEALDDEEQRADCGAIAALMQKIAQAPPRMWGANIVGFGDHHYTYANGKAAHWPQLAFAPRRKHITLYILMGSEGEDALLAKLGKHSHGKCCLHIRRLADLHLPTLRKLMTGTVKSLRSTAGQNPYA